MGGREFATCATGICAKSHKKGILSMKSVHSKAASLVSSLVPVLSVLSLMQLGLASASAAELCSAQSGPTRAAVIELYTSEGCSSCPPADKWLSTLKASAASTGSVIQAFHVGYWDYIGWVDRFASPAHTTRQRKIASLNRLTSIYTPQAVRDGRDWPDWGRSASSGLTAGKEPAGVSIALREVAPDQFEAVITPKLNELAQEAKTGTWSAYWSVTEHGHSSKVKSGENSGELLRHDYVVRQYTQAGDYSLASNAPQKLTWRSIAATPGHPRQINLVVFDPKTGKTLQALSASC
jgi:hypothetical protein